MFRLDRLLLPLDGSALSERSIPFARALAESSGAHLILVRAAQASTFPDTDPTNAQVKAARESQEYLDGVAVDLADTGVTCETASPYGDAADWILEEVRLREADLVVMSTHGRTSIDRWINGSVAESVLARSPVPVVLIRGHEREDEVPLISDRPRLLVPLDGSALAEQALPIAVTLAETLNAEITLVRAVPGLDAMLSSHAQRLTLYTHGAFPIHIEEQQSELRSEAQDYLERTREQLTSENARVQVDVREGDAAEVINAVSRDHDVSLVVMSTRGRTGVSRALLGSVAGEVLGYGDVPVLLVRPQNLSESAKQYADATLTG